MHRFSLFTRYDPVHRTIRFHDVIHRYIIKRKLPSDLANLHRHLLEIYRVHLSTFSWADLPFDEPYLWNNLAYHLLAAGQAEELVATVKDLRYLGYKSHARSATAVETDLTQAVGVAPQDEVLMQLQRSFRQNSHLLARCPQPADKLATLHSRLAFVPGLAGLAAALTPHLPPAYPTFLHPPPDLPHPALIRTLSGHTAGVRGCTFSADGRIIVSASLDQTLKVWDGGSGQERLTLSGHTAVVLGCAISADGWTIISVSYDRTLKVWDGHSGHCLISLAVEGPLSGCALSNDGRTLVAVGSGGVYLLGWGEANLIQGAKSTSG